MCDKKTPHVKEIVFGPAGRKPSEPTVILIYWFTLSPSGKISTLPDGPDTAGERTGAQL
jgi:hypothetical protein